MSQSKLTLLHKDIWNFEAKISSSNQFDFICFKPIKFNQICYFSKYICILLFLSSLSFSFLYSSILIFIYPFSPSTWGKGWRSLCKYMKLQRGRNSLRLCERSCWDRYMFTRSRRRSWVCPNARCILSRGSEYSSFFFSFLSFDMHLHPSSFYFDMNFGKARFA